MRIINVIVIKEGIVNSIDSFGIHSEDEASGVINKAENYFNEKCLEWGANENDLDSYLEDGYYAGGNFSICISWSEI